MVFEQFAIKHWSVRWRTQLMVLLQVGLTLIGFTTVLFGLSYISDLMVKQKQLVDHQQVVLADQNERFQQQRGELDAQQMAITQQAEALSLQKAVFNVYQVYPQFLFWRLASTSSLSDSDIRNGDTAEVALIEAVKVIESVDEELADATEVFLLDLSDFNDNIKKAIKFFEDGDDRRGRNTVSATQNNVLSMTSMLEVVLYVSDEVVVEAGALVNERLLALVQSVEATELTGEDMSASVLQVASSNELTLSQVKSKQTEVYFLIILITVLCFLVGILLSRSVALPLAQLQKKIKAIDNNADLTIKVDDSRRDDIGIIATSVNSLLASFNNMVSQVRKGASNIAEETDTQASNNEHIRQSLDNLHVEVDTVATAINEMTATVKGINDITSLAAESASEGVSLCQQASTQVSDSSGKITELNSELTSASNRLSELATQTDQIYAVVDVIQGVSEQTNLLALNAAIEAARAGEQGRGFAVVADEVRTLAQRTEQSSGEIKVMVEKFAKEVNTTVDSVESAKGAAQLTTSLEESTQGSISGLLTMMQSIRQMNDQISQSTQEQADATSAIDTSVMRISELLSSIAEKASSMATAMMRLTENTQVLEDQSREFKSN